MNSVNLIGRATKDPEVRVTPDGMSVATFTVAIDRMVGKDKEKQTDYPRITVFGRQAESCEKYLKKGRLVGVEGRIQTGSYTNKDGVKVYTTDVIANRVSFLEWGDTKERGQVDDHASRQAEMPAPDGMYYGDVTDEDIPF